MRKARCLKNQLSAVIITQPDQAVRKKKGKEVEGRKRWKLPKDPTEARNQKESAVQDTDG